MAYSEKVAQKIRTALKGHLGIVEKKMFGGMAFLLKGKMSVGVLKDDLVVRVVLEEFDKALAKKHVRPMDFTGRPMRGFVYVEPKGYKTKKQLEHWLALGLSCAEFMSKK